MSKGSKSKIRYKTPSPSLTAMAAPNHISSVRSSLGLEENTSELFQIRIEYLVPFRNQARKHFIQEEIDALAATIQEHGMRQPLTVIKSTEDDKKYEVVSGERRLRAAKQLGITRVPCIILQNISKANEIALIENLHRSDLHPIEAAQAYQAFLDSAVCLTQQEIADKLSIKKSTLSETLKLNSLPDEIKNHLMTNNLKSRDLFRKLLSSKSKAEMESILKIDHPVSRDSAIKSASILRITLSEGQYKIQKKAMSVLNADQKQQLKEKLLEIISLL